MSASEMSAAQSNPSGEPGGGNVPLVLEIADDCDTEKVSERDCE